MEQDGHLGHVDPAAMHAYLLIVCILWSKMATSGRASPAAEANLTKRDTYSSVYDLT
jgi:hypothetical protein